jgi:hypothetical protein
MQNVTFRSNYFVPICKMLELCNSLQVVEQKHTCEKKPRHIHNYIILHSPIFICTSSCFEQNNTTHTTSKAVVTHTEFYVTQTIYIIPFTGTKFITSAHLFSFLPLLASVLPAMKVNKYVSIWHNSDSVLHQLQHSYIRCQSSIKTNERCADRDDLKDHSWTESQCLMHIQFGQ